MLETMIVLLLVLCFLPLFAWFFYAFRTGIQTVAGMGYSFFAGLAAVAVASVLQFALDPLFLPLSGVPGLFVRAFVVAGLIEEASKLLMIRFIPDATGARVDGKSGASPLRSFLASSIAIGLSFAAFENIVYAVRNPSSVILRSLSSVPFHAALALFCGMCFVGRFSGRLRFSPGYAVGAVILHGIFDFFIEVDDVFVIPALTILALVVWFACRLWVRSRSGE
jgi:RsiW-degrading membrane proteinase PrsW (M82 family)